MSTRRARIKAVTSLPPRRKAARSENKSNDTSDKNSKSPRTPSADIKSPRLQNGTDSKSLEHITHDIIEKLITTDNAPHSSVTPLIDNQSNTNTPTVPHTPEQVRSTDKKISSNVFASPARKDSPRKTFASPIAPSPKVVKSSDQPRPLTPQNKRTPTAHKISDNNELQISEKIVSKINYNVMSKKDNARDDYNIPSVPESTDDETMDGIIPLKPAASVPKPIDVLKNEIISENAEVLFDPIIPLPSPSKVRPKLRPVPRLGPHRRNSVQGSASESEDETRRSLLAKDRQPLDVLTLQSLPNRDVSRIRNDSVCSSVSQVTTQPAAPSSPVRDKQQINKIRRQEESRRRMAMRRRREATKRDALTMYDLIFYNPTSNPLVLNEDEMKLKEAKEKQEAERISQEKEAAAKPPESPRAAPEPAPVPQIKLGPKGEIVLDEQSLVIKQTESDRKVSGVVHEGSWAPGAGGRRHRLCRAPAWPPPETVRFYRALAALGTDFTLMAQLFPDRTRKQLKVKFKKEEKLNGAQIDKALRASIQFDVSRLKQEFEEERALAARLAEQQRERLQQQKLAEKSRMKAAKEDRVRQSRGSKALEASKVPHTHKHAISAEDIIQQHKLRKRTSEPPAARVTPRAAADDGGRSGANTPSVHIRTPETINSLQIPNNVESGSLVVLTVNDPASPAKKMLQTYIANGAGKLTPIALPPSILNYVVGYMKKGGTPKASNVSSPQLVSPNSVASVESHGSSAVSGMPSPAKRQRHSSYTITQL